ncbi:site-specific integrase, partial [Dysgonomonas sp. GY617]|nr:site-specific integrase [Dysgonomonas sp. GY617]
SEFIKAEYNLSDIALKELDLAFIRKFDVFLKVEKNCAQNSAITRLKNLKKITRIAFSNDWMQKDPFVTYRFKFDETDPEFLTQEELNGMIRKEFPVQRLEIVRDIFAFCCYTGLSYVDVCKLTHANVSKGFDGHLWIMTKQTKTNVASNIRLLDIPQEIIEKYSDKRMNGKLLPSCSNQKMNEYLREIAELCGINKPLSTHVARHTFSTTVTLANGVPIERSKFCSIDFVFGLIVLRRLKCILFFIVSFIYSIPSFHIFRKGIKKRSNNDISSVIISAWADISGRYGNSFL